MEDDKPIEIKSILGSVRKKLGMGDDYTVFDPDIIDVINGVFATLYQIGFTDNGNPIHISDESAEWDTYFPEPKFSWVKDYVFIRTRLVFDPPTSSTLLENLKEQAREMEWRLFVEKDFEFAAAEDE